MSIQRKDNPIKFEEKFAKLNEPWVAGIIAQFNEYHVKVVKIQGEYIWHEHPDTDEVFIVLRGQLKIELPDTEVLIESGEMYVVPKGVEHKPSATAECEVLLIEPDCLFSKGESDQGYAEEKDVWI